MDESPKLEDFISASKPLNPDIGDEQLAAYWQRTYAPPAARTIAPSFDSFLKKAKDANPGVGEGDLRKYWDTTYKNDYETQPNSFMRGISTAVQQFPELGYGVAALGAASLESLFGEGGLSTAAKKWAVEGYKDWGSKISEKSRDTDEFTTAYEKAKGGDADALFSWLGYGIGYGLTQAGTLLTGAGVGAVVGRTALKGIAEKVGKDLIAKEVAKGVTEEVAVANVASKLGQFGAIGAQAYGMEAGEIGGDLVSENVNRTLTGAEIGKAVGASIVAGSLEFAADSLGYRLLRGESLFGKGTTGLAGRAQRAAAGAAVDVPAEFGTEYAQTQIEEYGKGKEPFTPEVNRQALNAGALGAITGGVVGTAGGLASGAQPAPVAVPPAIPAPATHGVQNQPLMSEQLRAAQQSPTQKTFTTPEGVVLVVAPDGTVMKQEDYNLYQRIVPKPTEETKVAEKVISAPTIDESIDEALKSVGVRTGSIRTQDLPEAATGPATQEARLANVALEADIAKADAAKARDVAGAALVSRGQRALEEAPTAMNAAMAEAKVVQQPSQGAPITEEAPKQEFASTQTPLPNKISNQVKQAARNIIAKEDIDPAHGLEDRPHITVKYGLHEANIEAVKKIVTGRGPVTAKITSIEIFKPSDKNYEVVVARVDSPQLNDLNKAISAAIPNTDTFPDYKPHITLGYVKVGTGDKYADAKTGLEGRTIRLNTIEVTDQNENVTPIQLTGPAADKVQVTQEGNTYVARMNGEEVGNAKFNPSGTLKITVPEQFQINNVEPVIRQYVEEKTNTRLQETKSAKGQKVYESVARETKAQRIERNAPTAGGQEGKSNVTPLVRKDEGVSGKKLPKDVTVRVKRIEEETGRGLTVDENGAVALASVDEDINKARMLLECLRS